MIDHPDNDLALKVIDRVRALGWAVAASSHPRTGNIRIVGVKDEQSRQVDGPTLYAVACELARQVGVGLEA